nr:MAG TPA: hypothetical protein [Caudoviricetes sp.]
MCSKNTKNSLFSLILGLFRGKIVKLAKSGAQKHEKSFRMYIVVEGS